MFEIYRTPVGTFIAEYAELPYGLIRRGHYIFSMWSWPGKPSNDVQKKAR